MKHKIGTILLVFVLAITFMVNVNAQTTIKEDATKYEGDVYIIGSSKFDSNVIVTGTMAGVAGAREAILQYTIYGNQDFDPESIKVYYYCGDDGTWNVLPRTTEDEFTELTEKEVEELVEDLNIYYVNEEEKTIELPYDVTIKDGYELKFYTETFGKQPEIKYEGGKLIIPATVTQFTTYMTNKEDPDDMVQLDTIYQEESEFANNTVSVKTLSELKQAIADEKAQIRLDANIANITETITIPYRVELKGAGYKLAFKDINKTEEQETASGLVIAGDNSYITDLTIEMDEREGWQANYAMQVYGAQGVSIYNYTGTKSDAALLVNGSQIALSGTINVTGNEFGGIEISKGEDPTLMESYLSVYGSIKMDDEAIAKPVVWVEAAQGVLGYNEQNLVANSNIPAALGKNQIFFYTTQDVYRNLAVSTAQELILAATIPEIETITIAKDIDLPTAVIINRPVTVNLNDHKLTVSKDTAGDGVFHVIENGYLTINGEGIVNGVGDNKWNITIFAEGGYVEINGGTYTNVGATGEDPTHYDLIYAKNGGRVVINGGHFEGQTPAWLLNLHDSTRDISGITVFGGTFVGFNPANNAAEGPNTTFVDADYKVIEKDGAYTVEKLSEQDVARINYTAYTDLQTAVNEAPTNQPVLLLQDIDLPTAVKVEKTVSVELNGHTLTVSKDTAGDGVFHVLEGGHLTISGEGVVNGVGDNKWNIAIFADGGDVVINDGTYTNVGATGEDPTHYDLIYAKNGGTVTITGGRFEGQTPAWLLNIYDTHRDTSWIAVFGGTFVGLNPSESQAEGDETKFVADGYEVVQNGDEYTVVWSEQNKDNL